MKLLHPLTIGKVTVSDLNFRDHTTAADYLSFDKRGGVAQRISLIASITGTDESLITQLHGADYRRAEQLVDQMMAADELEASPDQPVVELTPEQKESLGKLPE